MESKNAKALYHFRPDLYILKPYSALRLANIRDMCYTKVNYNIVWYSEKEGIYEKRSKRKRKSPILYRQQEHLGARRGDAHAHRGGLPYHRLLGDVERGVICIDADSSAHCVQCPLRAVRLPVR